jgi:hypothetical protein
MSKIVSLFIMCLFPSIALAASASSHTQYVASQGGKVVASGSACIGVAQKPESFVVTLTKNSKLVKTFKGTTLQGFPLSFSNTEQVGYVAAGRRVDHRTVKLQAGTVTTGYTFLLNAGRHASVQVVGSIDKLLSMKSVHASGMAIQVPDIASAQINETVVLKKGQSQVFPMGKYLVKVSRV